jgi:hypothetical protein
MKFIPVAVFLETAYQSNPVGANTVGKPADRAVLRQSAPALSQVGSLWYPFLSPSGSVTKQEKEHVVVSRGGSSRYLSQGLDWRTFPNIMTKNPPQAVAVLTLAPIRH